MFPYILGKYQIGKRQTLIDFHFSSPGNSKHLDDCIRTGDIPNRMIDSRRVLIQKNARKGNAVANYWPIASFNLLWKLLTDIISEKVYDYLNQQNVLPGEQNCCWQRTIGTKDQLLIDKAVVRNCRRRKTKLKMAWVDLRKAYDMGLDSWILKTLGQVWTAIDIRSA